MPLNERPDVVIAGAGVAGLGVAVALAREGIRSVLVDQAPVPGTVDRGDVLHQASIDLFGLWGIKDLLDEALPLRLQMFGILNQFGAHLFDVDLSVELDAPASLTVLRHTRIHEVLAAAAKRTGLVDIVYGCKATSLRRHGSRVVGLNTSVGDIDAHLTVVAAGGHSPLREGYIDPIWNFDYREKFVNAYCRGVPGYGDAAFYVLGPQGVTILLPLPGNMLRVGLQALRDDDGDFNFTELLVERLQTFPGKELQIEHIRRYRVTRSMCGRFWEPGLVLVGDAAHTTHPAGGQGMNLAFGDAACLATLVRGCVMSRSNLDRACEQFHRVRHAEVVAVLRRTHAMAMAGRMRGYPSAVLRSGLLMLASRSSTIKRRVFSRIVEAR